MYIFRVNFLLLCGLCSLPHPAIHLPVKCQCLHRLWLAGSTHACSHKGCSPTSVERLFTFGSGRMTVPAVRASAPTAGTSAPDCMLGLVVYLFCILVSLQRLMLKSTLKREPGTVFV